MAAEKRIARTKILEGQRPLLDPAGITRDNELKSRDDVVPRLRRSIVDSYLKHGEATLQLLRAASGSFRCREPGLQLAVDFDRETGRRQFGTGLGICSRYGWDAARFARAFFLR